MMIGSSLQPGISRRKPVANDSTPFIMANTMLPTPSNGTIAAVPVSTVDRETAARPLGGSKRKQQEGADDDDDEDDGSDVVST